jgi:hypothetical protein
MTEGQKALNEWEMSQAEYRSLLESLLAKAKEYPVGFFHEAEDGFTASRRVWGWSFEQKIDGRLTWAHLSKHDLLAGSLAQIAPSRYLALLRRAHRFLCAGEAPSDAESFTRECRKRWLAYMTWPAWAGTAIGGLALLWWLTSNALMR